MAGSHGINFFQTLSDTLGVSQYETLVAAVIVAILVLVLASMAVGSLARSETPLIPDRTFTIKNLFDLLATFLVGLGDMVMGKENRKYLPFVSTIFIYLLFGNLIGLVPGLSSPTDQIMFNAGMAITVFVLFNFWGIREHGVLNYLKHFCGPIHVSIIVLFVSPLLFLVEMTSLFFRPITLTLRLFGNMTADHAVLQAFLDLSRDIYIPIPLFFYLMGTLVCFIQAFVFCVLTMVYIRLAVAHEGGEDHEEGHEHAAAH